MSKKEIIYNEIRNDTLLIKPPLDEKEEGWQNIPVKIYADDLIDFIRGETILISLGDKIRVDLSMDYNNRKKER